MNFENLRIEIDEDEISDLYRDMASLEVEFDEDLTGMCRLKLNIERQADGVWRWIDDERLVIWKKIKVYAGFDGEEEVLFTGYITQVKPDFAFELTDCTLEIWGLDESVALDQEEILKDWPGSKDSDIAAAIFDKYNITPEVEDTRIIHDETVSTIVQRETDWQLLKRLALRNGYEVFVFDGRGYFRAMLSDTTPQPILIVHFDRQRNVEHFSLEVNAMTASQVAMNQIDRLNKEVLRVTATSSEQPPLGNADARSFLAADLPEAKIHMSQNVATGQPEMEAICNALYKKAGWFVSGHGRVRGNQYGHMLQTGKTVTIKGVGETYSGIYLVTHVTHQFTPDGYIQDFNVKRNALFPDGTEDFSS